MANVMTYNYSGGNIPNMSIFGTPADVPIPDMPTSVPSVDYDGLHATHLAYQPGVVEMQFNGLPSGSLINNSQIPVGEQPSVTGADMQPRCAFCDLMTAALLGGELNKAPVAKQGVAGINTSASVLPSDA